MQFENDVEYYNLVLISFNSDLIDFNFINE